MSIGDIIKVNIDGIPTLMEIKGFDNQHVVLVSTGNGQNCLIVDRQKLEEDLATLNQGGFNCLWKSNKIKRNRLKSLAF